MVTGFLSGTLAASLVFGLSALVFIISGTLGSVLVYFWLKISNDEVNTTTKFSFYDAVSFALIITMLLWVAALSIHQTHLGYDDTAYHLPIMAAIIQQKSSFAIAYTAFSMPIGYYPASGEWLLAVLFSFGISIENLFLFNHLVVVGIWFSARKWFICLGENQLAGLYAALLLSAPVITAMLGLVGVDLLFLWGFILCLLSLETKNTTHAGIGLGFLVGTKYLGVLYAAALFPFLLAVFWKKIFSKKTLIASTIFFFTGGFWYFRNALLTQNPFFPQQFAWLKGYGQLSQRIWSENILGNLLSGHNSAENAKMVLGEFTQQFGLGYWIVLAFGLFLLFINRQITKAKTKKYAALFSFCVLTYAISPFGFSNLTGNIRYAIPLLLLPFSMLSLQSNHEQNKYPRAIKVIIVIILWTGFGFTNIFQHFKALESSPDRFYQPQTELAGLISAKNWISQQSKETPIKKIAYSGFNWHFLLYDDALKREVRYININHCQGCTYFDFKDEKDSIRANPSKENWIQNLNNFGAEYLITKDYPNIKNWEEIWAKEEKFMKVFDENGVKIFDLQKN